MLKLIYNLLKLYLVILLIYLHLFLFVPFLYILSITFIFNSTIHLFFINHLPSPSPTRISSNINTTY